MFVLFSVTPRVGCPEAAATRPLQIDDLLHAEYPSYPLIRSSSFSPDGSALAFSVVRSQAQDPKNWIVDVDGSLTHSDVWLQRAPKEKPRRITDGSPDSSGWSIPIWSPDGKQLVMASTRGGVFRLWAFDVSTGRLSLVSDYPLDVSMRFSTVWVDNQRVLFYSSDRYTGVVFPSSIEIARSAWSKALAGEYATSSALGSNIGMDSSLSTSPVCLILADLSENKSFQIADGDIARFELSPDRRYVAVARASRPLPPRMGEKLSAARRPKLTLEVHALNGALAYKESRPLSAATMSWAPKSSELAYWISNESDTVVPRLSVLSMASGLTKSASLTGLVPRADRPILWSTDGSPLVNAGVDADNSRKQQNRFDWFVVDSDRTAINITAFLPSPPSMLYSIRRGSAFVGVADGSLWRIEASGHRYARKVDFGVESKVSALDIIGFGSIAGPRSWLLESNSSDSGPSFYSVDANTLRASLIVLPPESGHSSELQALAYSAGSGQALIYKTDGNVIELIRSGPRGAEVVHSMNEWARDIANNPTQTINYTSLEGEDLFGCVILPPDYVSGRRYPLLTWVYAGMRMDAQCSRLTEYAPARAALQPASLNVRVAASKGYAVLLPSMPMHLNGENDVPLAHLTNGVLPAIDKLISLGLADPDRVFIAGQSFGGFSTLGIVTQTPRFKAAAAFGGYSDFTSAFGSADERSRYREYLQEIFFPMEMVEEAQASLDYPPWKIPDRYRRASPISYIENVVTPVLMLQGEQDVNPIEQAEEFFSSLYRQGKPAELVRYWGEGHLIRSPGNIRDVWNRLMAWFDNYGDITRDSHGSVVFNGDRVRSRDGATALTPADFARFNLLSSAEPADVR